MKDKLYYIPPISWGLLMWDEIKGRFTLENGIKVLTGNVVLLGVVVLIDLVLTLRFALSTT